MIATDSYIELVHLFISKHGRCFASSDLARPNEGCYLGRRFSAVFSFLVASATFPHVDMGFAACFEEQEGRAHSWFVSLPEGLLSID
jgi:hypothetical protein